eukprot:TRINITY_DN4562_c0_g3_i1.p1 TRINITY_DN4562_c0_g3~~TRINITY_DN4562_c0_g3_i1.p1  ORF type:complete len:278 (-),score=115.73 TRINITY_DN4562_c0_g3_i1:91-864(-)
MKLVALLLFVACLTSFLVSIEGYKIQGLEKFKIPQGTLKVLSKMRTFEKSQVGAEGRLCGVCVSFMDEALDEILNIIANGGIIAGCADLCGKLKSKTEQAVCSLLCDVVGIKEFIKIIDQLDPDPVYICESFGLCEIKDGNAKIVSVSVSPSQGPAGTTFTLDLKFSVLNVTGTGEVEVDITPVSGSDIGQAELIENLAVGNYEYKFSLDTTPSDDQPFSPGVYKTAFAVCEGSCGSKHPHSKVYDQQTTQFTITGK